MDCEAVTTTAFLRERGELEIVRSGSGAFEREGRWSSSRSRARLDTLAGLLCFDSESDSFFERIGRRRRSRISGRRQCRKVDNSRDFLRVDSPRVDSGKSRSSDGSGLRAFQLVLESFALFLSRTTAKRSCHSIDGLFESSCSSLTPREGANFGRFSRIRAR